jgi:hypothetical protein
MDHKDLAIEITDRLFQENPKLKYDELIKFNAMRIAFITILKDILFPVLRKLEPVIPNFFNSVKEGLDIAESLDVYAQTMCISQEATIKVMEKSESPKAPRFSLKLIKVLLKVQKFKEK